MVDDRGQIKLFNNNSKEMFSPPHNYLGDARDWYRESEFFYYKGDKIPHKNTPANMVLRGEKFSDMKVSLRFPNKLVHLEIS